MKFEFVDRHEDVKDKQFTVTVAIYPETEFEIALYKELRDEYNKMKDDDKLVSFSAWETLAMLVHNPVREVSDSKEGENEGS